MKIGIKTVDINCKMWYLNCVFSSSVRFDPLKTTHWRMVAPEPIRKTIIRSKMIPLLLQKCSFHFWLLILTDFVLWSDSFLRWGSSGSKPWFHLAWKHLICTSWAWSLLCSMCFLVQIAICPNVHITIKHMKILGQFGNVQMVWKIKIWEKHGNYLT